VADQSGVPTAAQAASDVPPPSAAPPGDAPAPHPHHSHGATPIARRFVFLDALRGIAAIGVATCHFVITPGMDSTYQATLTRPLYAVLSRGYLGVEIFFVLSGFVIAYTQRGERITAPYFGRFILRRSIRLDPPYWVTMAVMLALNLITVRSFHDANRSFPGISVVILNLLYLQNLTHVTGIVVVAWTLCLELQFYLVLTLVTALAQRAAPAGRRVAGFPSWADLLLFVPLAAISLASEVGWVHIDPAIFLAYWHMFFLGAAVWWTIDRRIAPIWVWVLAGAELAAAALARDPRPVAAAATAIAIYLVSRMGRLERWSGGAALQFLGRISYSIYLGHAILGQKMIKLGQRLTGDNRLAAVGWLVLAYVVTILVAYTLYRFVERPAMRLASRIKSRRERLLAPTTS
jgi:peptidoglycan/LPS O-acetylase OafA/YrhL